VRFSGSDRQIRKLLPFRPESNIIPTLLLLKKISEMKKTSFYCQYQSILQVHHRISAHTADTTQGWSKSGVFL
jgi:hypothetical protein